MNGTRTAKVTTTWSPFSLSPSRLAEIFTQFLRCPFPPLSHHAPHRSLSLFRAPFSVIFTGWQAARSPLPCLPAFLSIEIARCSIANRAIGGKENGMVKRNGDPRGRLERSRSCIPFRSIVRLYPPRCRDRLRHSRNSSRVAFFRAVPPLALPFPLSVTYLASARESERSRDVIARGDNRDASTA